MILFYLSIPFVLLTTLIYSVIAALTRPIDRSARIYHSLMRGWSRTLLWLLRVKVNTVGREHLQEKTPYLFIANHSSYLDIIAIGVSLPNGGLFVYKEELTKVPVWGWSLRYSPFIMIRRTDPRKAMESIEGAAREIRERSQSVVIFPEGTRSTDGVLGEFKRGGFLLAAKTGVPLVPLAIQGSHKLLPRGDWRVRSGEITVNFGRPIPGRSELNRSEERELQERLREELQMMLGTTNG
ncbi:MAG: 1-acyl-sn-glycerol-3-phosphate acyltransferase [Ignavibacteriae bacterium]|nr:1-acyl-sn-glycerol-3-phosphate acyltransferase [Ignavibacteriota bacterium]MCB9215798.1 1-acyl-sn-glycerol-3-phosphate acyltransferase [Ignavibacteria bacterium]